MTPIIKKQEQETILTSEIKSHHIVAAIIEGRACLYTKGWNQDEDYGSFKALNSDFSCGNGYRYAGGGIRKMVEYVIENETGKVAVFHQKDWKKALQWLIDNCE